MLETYYVYENLHTSICCWWKELGFEFVVTQPRNKPQVSFCTYMLYYMSLLNQPPQKRGLQSFNRDVKQCDTFSLQIEKDNNVWEVT